VNEELAGLLLECGRPVKDEGCLVGEDWRDFDWDHWEAGCGGWAVTDQTEVVEIPLEGGGILFTVTHVRCTCRVYPLVTLGLEGTRGE
jgi:hypothetical protein